MLRKADPRVATPFHIRLMQVIAEAGPIYGISNLRLQGGTALAAYHLHHRESEDLDFFADAPLDARDWGKFVQERAAAESIELVPDGPPNMGMARYMATSPEAPGQQVKIDTNSVRWKRLRKASGSDRTATSAQANSAQSAADSRNVTSSTCT